MSAYAARVAGREVFTKVRFESRSKKFENRCPEAAKRVGVSPATRTLTARQAPARCWSPAFRPWWWRAAVRARSGNRRCCTVRCGCRTGACSGRGNRRSCERQKSSRAVAQRYCVVTSCAQKGGFSLSRWMTRLRAVKLPCVCRRQVTNIWPAHAGSYIRSWLVGFFRVLCQLKE